MKEALNDLLLLFIGESKEVLQHYKQDIIQICAYILLLFTIYYIGSNQLDGIPFILGPAENSVQWTRGILDFFHLYYFKMSNTSINLSRLKWYRKFMYHAM